MTNISEQLKSLKETIGGQFVKPDPQLLEKLVQNLHNTLHPQGLEYLKRFRGFTDETIKHFQLGYDVDKRAVAIPIFKDGVLVNIKYRFLEPQDTKYIGEKGGETWILNDTAIEYGRKKGYILITEGEFDAMSARQCGIEAVISPSSGKDSFGAWLERLEGIKRVFIAYDNDTGGKESGRKLAERLGLERCFEVNYGNEKDANEFMLKHAPEELKKLLKAAKPFTRQDFKSLGDVILERRSGDRQYWQSPFIPDVKFKGGWMAVISGRQNVGKTSYMMNVANELAELNIATLVLPFERGIDNVGERLLQVRYSKTEDDFDTYDAKNWDALVTDVAELPIYFARPAKDDVIEFMVKAKNYFDVKVVIIDHLDYLVRQVRGGNRESAISDTLQQMKSLAEESGLVLLIVSHVRKDPMGGFNVARPPSIEDLKGSSSSYQDPEVVVMLSETENRGEILVDILKNKGKMGRKLFQVDAATGVFQDSLKHVASPSELAEAAKEAEELWNSIP